MQDTGRWRGSDAGFILKHFQLLWGCLMLNLGHCSFSPSWLGSCFQDGHLFKFCFFLSFCVFCFCFVFVCFFCCNLQPQPNKSPDDIYFTPQHDGSLLEGARASCSNTPSAFGSSVGEEPVFFLNSS